MTRRCLRQTRGLLLVLTLFASGCAAFGTPEIAPQNRQEALFRIDQLRQQNAALRPYKGIGQMGFFGPEGAWAVRGAWVGAPPGRFRVEALGLTGQPLAKLICDQRACHFLFSENGCYQSRTSAEKSLKPLTGVAVRVDDLVLLLGGGVPVSAYDSAWVEPAADRAGDVLVLRKRWGGIVEKLFFAPGGERVTRIETYSLLGLQYRADIGPALADSDGLPGMVRIVNEENAGMQADVERAWTEDKLPADVFVPKLPDVRRCD